MSVLLRWFSVLLLGLPFAAFANFHLMKVAEVFPGTQASPNAQYIVLQMTASGQNVVGGHRITVFNNTGDLVGTFTFSGVLPNAANQEKIFIATTEAVSFFGISANLTMTPVIDAAGGRACFDGIPVDCVSWGDFANKPTGSALNPFAFNPSSAPLLGQPNTGLILGKAIKRRMDFAGESTVLDEIDDTNDCAKDFFLADPAPKNNGRANGTIPSAECGNGVIEGLEGCDDGNDLDNDSCSSLCQVVFCGDGIFRKDITDPSDPNFEECDDLNFSEEDTCSTLCRIPRCGDGIQQSTERCDDGNLQNGDGCDDSCFVEAPGCAVDPVRSLSVLLFFCFVGFLLLLLRSKPKETL